MSYLASLLLIIQFGYLVGLLYARRQWSRLPTQAAELTTWPKVSIVIPARNEAAEIEPALSSVLRLDYPDREIIAVNDRSTDATGALLHRLQGQHPELRVITIERLPAGWLGKNYALHTGAAAATGALLLFTDADVVFSPTTLKKAIGVLERERLDHLTLSPRVRSASRLVNLLAALFWCSFSLFVKPWRARDPRAPQFVGLGAFNLVRRLTYVHIGGHRRIALRPDDDTQLGKLIKQAGFRQDCWQALEDLQLAWYPSFRAFLQGLEKNVLAGRDYRVGELFLTLTGQLLLGLAPWGLLIMGDPLTRVLALAAVLAAMTGFGLFFHATGCPWPLVVLEPIILVLFVYTCARSAVLALVRGGIIWRGTFYPLSLLRQNSR